MRARERQYAILSLVLMMVLVMPPVRDGLERSMTTHVAVQLASLAIAGWFVGAALRRRANGISRVVNANGLSGLTISILATIFWMLPRTLDDALRDPYIEVAKFLAVPLLVGFPLALSWPRLNPILRGFLKLGLISKLAVLGWLYSAAPVRLCTSYLQGDQALLGELLFFLMVALSLTWSLPWFFADARERTALGPLARTGHGISRRRRRDTIAAQAR